MAAAILLPRATGLFGEEGSVVATILPLRRNDPALASRRACGRRDLMAAAIPLVPLTTCAGERA